MCVPWAYKRRIPVLYGVSAGQYCYSVVQVSRRLKHMLNSHSFQWLSTCSEIWLNQSFLLLFFKIYLGCIPKPIKICLRPPTDCNASGISLQSTQPTLKCPFFTKMCFNTYKQLSAFPISMSKNKQSRKQTAFCSRASLSSCLVCRLLLLSKPSEEISWVYFYSLPGFQTICN